MVKTSHNSTARAPIKPRKIARKRPDEKAPAPDASADETLTHDPAKLAENMSISAKLWQQIAHKMSVALMDNPTTSIGHADPFHIGETFVRAASKMASNPMELMSAQMDLVKGHLNLWQDTTQRLLGKTKAPDDDIQDRRFKSDAWSDSAIHDYIRRSYLMNSEWVKDTVSNVKGLDAHTAQKINFFTKQFLDAVSPSNFVLTNPDVMQLTLESNGQNLVKGLQKMLNDVERGKGTLRISTTDHSAFELGKNLACTKGSVVFENDLMQLIQYAPLTKQAYETPLLIIPAWINKYYVLDLQPDNSFIRWAVSQGFTVFAISWVNPDRTLGQKRFDDYLSEGPLTALDVIQTITQSDQTHLAGYCLGGTLTATTLAYLRAHGEDHRIASATYLTTMIDFSDAGDLGVFIDDEQLESLEDRMSGKGFLDANDMATTFNMLRSNDMIWSFVVNNYLMGKDPFPFDLLYWNSDSTRMPATMHSFYLRQMYQKNLLIKPGGIELLDTPLNITKITTPSYILSTKEDHIAPWVATYAATQIYDGAIRFVLAQSGHVAGVISSPSKKKYGYWINESLPPRPEHWLQTAHFIQDSWWPDWAAWLAPQSGGKIPARAVGSKQFQPIEDAPGAYARMRV